MDIDRELELLRKIEALVAERDRLLLIREGDAPPAEARGLRIVPPEGRPQDPSMDGRGLKILKTMEHGGEYPDMMANAIRIGDAQGRSAVYVVLKVDGKVVDAE